MPERTLWDTWLVVVVVAVTAYGAGLVVAGGALAGVFDALGFGMRDAGVVDGPQRDHVLLVYGVLGAVMVGWMTTLLGVVVGPLRRRERWAWVTVDGATGVWFVVDTAFSLAVGSVAHALFNLGFLVALAAPLVAVRPRRSAAGQTRAAARRRVDP